MNIPNRKMGKKKNKPSVSLQLQSYQIERDFGVPSAPSCSEDKKEKRLPSSTSSTEGTLMVYVENDIEFEEQDTSVLEPPRGYRTEDSDEDRVMQWFMKEERKKRMRRLRNSLGLCYSTPVV